MSCNKDQEAVAAIQSSNLGENLMVTRSQNKRALENQPSKEDNKRQRSDLSPVVYAILDNIGSKLPTRAMMVLLDSGSSHTMIKQTSLPHGAVLESGKPKRTTTTNGVFATTSSATIQRLKFPEFGNHCIERVHADVFHSPTCCYDIILGRDTMDIMGIKLNF